MPCRPIAIAALPAASTAMSKAGASEAARAAEVERRKLIIPMIRRVPGAEIAGDDGVWAD